MELSLKRVWILSEAKLKSFLSNKLISSYILFPIIIVMALDFLNTRLENHSATAADLAIFLIWGSLLNVAYVPYVTPATLLAEEKEKNTLRVLMVSSISGLEFFLGNVLPMVVVSSIVQAALVPILGIQFSAVQFTIYMLISILGITSSAVLGMCFGIISKNQMSATLITLPVTMILMGLPVLRNLSPLITTLADNMYTGVMMQAIPKLVANQTMSLSLQSWVVLVGELLLITAWFLWLYTRNGYDRD